jgi:hypothetical protein
MIKERIEQKKKSAATGLVDLRMKVFLSVGSASRAHR